MNQNRVIAIAAVGLVAAIALIYGGYTYMSGDKLPDATASAATSTIETELLVPGPLGDATLGDSKAPLTVVEYASLTCSHCADFSNREFPAFERDYIETGKVHFIFRPFPYDPIATGAFMLAQCAGPDRYFGFVKTLFAQQAQWAFVEAPQEALKKFAIQGGFSEESFNACMDNQEIFEHVQTVAQRGATEFGVKSTPTFFVGGQRVEGVLPYEEFKSILDKQLADKTKAAAE